MQSNVYKIISTFLRQYLRLMSDDECDQDVFKYSISYSVALIERYLSHKIFLVDSISLNEQKEYYEFDKKTLICLNRVIYVENGIQKKYTDPSDICDYAEISRENLSRIKIKEQCFLKESVKIEYTYGYEGIEWQFLVSRIAALLYDKRSVNMSSFLPNDIKSVLDSTLKKEVVRV